MIEGWDDSKKINLGFGVKEEYIVITIDDDQWAVTVEEAADMIKALMTCSYMAWATRSAKNN